MDNLGDKEGVLAPSSCMVVTKEEIIALIKERGSKCEFPFCNSTFGLQRHHKKEKSHGVDNSKKNSLILCLYHHEFAHRNKKKFWELFNEFTEKLLKR